MHLDKSYFSKLKQSPDSNPKNNNLQQFLTNRRITDSNRPDF